METDIELLDGKRRLLTGDYKVRVDLAELTLMELNHLRSGIDSAIEFRERGIGRCWHVPKHAVEVFVAK
jgi:hypothetical protein